jgi:hypothetical protein
MGRPKKERKNTNCLVCSRTFEVFVSQQRKYCSVICYNKTRFGETNSNFGKRWNEKQKQKQSLLVESKVDEAYRIKVGSANKGKKFSQERIFAMHANRTPESYVRQHSEESKRKIGEKSSAKFTDEYLLKQKEKFVNLGYWLSDSERSDFEIYQLHSNWKTSMWDLVEDSKNLKSVGVFNSKSNRNGYVRDHIFSRFDGFKAGVFPEILRHPVNCQLLTHSENSSKKEKSWLTIEELYSKIEKYKNNWKEQQFVLNLISAWKSGARFSAEEHRRKSNASRLSDS